MLESLPVSSSVLAFVTTVHAAMVVLRLHRGGSRAFALALPSMAFAALTWVLTTPAWVVGGVLANIAWFAACERLARGAPAAGPQRPPGQTGDAPAGASPPPITRQGFLSVPVLAVHDESPTIRTFRLRRPPEFAFEAGQFLTVQVQADGQRHVRCYSISSAPEVPGYLEISVRRQGFVSNLLHATLRAGSAVMVRAPAGRFVYPAGDDRPLVFVAGGVGITPLMSMARHAVMAEPGRPLVLLYSAKGPEDLAFRDELVLLSRTHRQLRVVFTVTRDTSEPFLRHGRIDSALVGEVVPDPAAAIFLMCGPASLIEGLRQLLLSTGVPASQVRSEAFEAAAAVGAKLPASPDLHDAGAAEHDDTGRLTLSRSQRQVQMNSGESLLDAAERAGGDIPFVCRSGVCGTCRTRLVAGEARCTSDVLTTEDRNGGYVLPCVTWGRGDCVLEA